MKNPQDQLFFASGFAVVRNALANGHILTREQRLYCLHAINQHDKLVAMLDEYQFANQGLCPCCLGDNEDGHNDKCELAAILKGE